jgi:aspartyl aminopeptidase
MSDILKDFHQFLQQSPTPWHAVEAAAERLSRAKAIHLEEGEKWKLQKGKRYFVKRGGSICAFSLPEKSPTKMTILAAHTDSPALKLKPNPEVVAEPIHLLETEIYGGPLLSSWFNRDLVIAGRIVFEDKQGKTQEKLVFLEETPLFIPQLAIHLDREVNDKGLMINKQDHMRPIFALSKDKKNLLEPLLKKHVPFKNLLSFDLFLVPLEKPRYLGINDEMLASYRLDNLASSHACITACITIWSKAPASDALQMTVLWDAEEIGSRTVDGAASPFAADILKRIQAFYAMTDEEFICMKTDSLCLSVDVAHAYSPNHAKKYDPQHQLMPGHGIVIKYNADKKYVTDAKTAAPVISACKKAKLPFQSFASHSNFTSGSTIGPIFAHTMGIPTADIGSAIFSMHSTREVMAVKDHLEMCQLLTALLKR